MGQYRKSDQYYIDQYDRMTIERLKELEVVVWEAQQKFRDSAGPDSGEIPTEAFGKNMFYLDSGVRYAKNKRHTIEEWIRADERKDHLVLSHSIPVGVTCLTCGVPMLFDLYDFVDEDARLIFYFSCPRGHKPRRAFYANGQERFFKKRGCSYCGGELASKRKKSKYQVTFTDTCGVCDKTETFTYDTRPEKVLPIDEAERKKYCTDFIGRNSFEDDLEAIAVIAEIAKEQEIKIKSGFDKVQQLNIAQMENILTEAIEKADFIKVQFDRPKTSRYLMVGFSAQDPTDRNGQKSIKALKTAVTDTLFPTNWRLTSPGIDCKLGFLTGELKGYSVEEDLIRIAQEISKKELS